MTNTERIDPRADLEARWRPSDSQVAEADAMLATGNYPKGVFTAHLLVNKRPFFWDAGVEVIPVDGVFTDLNECWSHTVETGLGRPERSIMGGFAWHAAPGEWAVWELASLELYNRSSPINVVVQ